MNLRQVGLRNLGLGMVLASAPNWVACGDDDDAVRGDSGVQDGGGKTPDTGDAIGAEAAFTLAPVASDEDAGADISSSAQLPISGRGKFRRTAEGIDLSIDFINCRRVIAYPMRLLEGGDCDSALAGGKVMTDSDEMPFATCHNSVSGQVRYSRPPDAKPEWSVGGSAATDVVGHAIVLYDPDTKEPLACGAITRVAGTPAPAADAGADAGVTPSIDTLSVLVGGCLTVPSARMSSEPCPVPEELVACARLHCALDACVNRCPDYVGCVENAEDQCVPLCPATTVECRDCLAEAQSCSFGFCSSMFQCADPPKPGGKCDELRKCCESQTMEERKLACLSALETISGIAGDIGCDSATQDVGLLINIHKSPECPWGMRPESEP